MVLATLLAIGPHGSPEARAFPTDLEEANADLQPIFTVPADRALAAEWLGLLKADAAYEALIALCTDPDGGVRHSAVGALGKLGDPRATATLARLAADPAQEKVEGARTFSWSEWVWFSGYIDSEKMKPKPRIEYDVRREAQQALLHLRPEQAGGPPREPTEAIAELTALLKTDLRHENDEHRAFYLVALMGEAGTGRASAAALFQALEHRGNSMIRSDAASALAGRKDGAEVMAALRPLLARPDVKAQTLVQYLVIVRRLQPEEAPALARRIVEQMPTADEQTWVNFPGTISAALRRSLRVEDAPVLDRLAEQLAPEAPVARDIPKRREQVLTLKRSLLEGPSKTEEAARRMDAGEYAREFPQSAAELVRLLQGPRNLKSSFDEDKFYKATRQVGVLKVREAVPVLLTLLDGHTMTGYGGDIAATTPGMAAWALIQIADPASIPELRKWTERSLADFEAKGGTGVLIAYGALAGEKAIPALTAILKYPPRLGHPEDEWRMRVVQRFFNPVPAYAFGEPRTIWRPETRAVPGFYWPQAAAACALSRIDSPRAREALRDCLAHADGPQLLDDDVIEAIFHAIPDDLNAWSRRILAQPEGEHPWEPDSLRTTAVAVQLHYFPQQSAALVRDILSNKAHPLRTPVMKLLRAQPMTNDDIVSALGTLLDDPLPEAVKQRREVFERRLETIDAIGFQGGPAAVAILLRVAAR